MNIIADIGLVGFPNAGKSSLLDYFTNARPKIAPYPFRTKIPNLGVLHIDDEQDIIIADIPGILEGASEGVGLGIRFLKHISRTAGLAFLIDLSDDNYLTAYQTLCGELSAYSEELTGKKRVVIATKLDLEGTKERLKELREQLPDIPVLGISVFNRWGLDEVRDAFVALVEELAACSSAADTATAAGSTNAAAGLSASGIDNAAFDAIAAETAALSDSTGSSGFFPGWERAASPIPAADTGNSFMHADLEDPVYTQQEGFGATVSLSRKRRGKK